MTDTAGLQVLVVCRANRARSPLAAALLRRYAETHDGVAPPHVLSSGVDARDGEPLLPSVGNAAGRHGVSLEEHLSRRFRVEDVASADLVITFERALRQAIVAQRPSSVPRTFTLRELVRLVRSRHWRPEWNGTPDVAVRLHALRPLVEPGEDDSRDPVGANRRTTRQLVDELVRDVEGVAPALLGPRARETPLTR